MAFWWWLLQHSVTTALLTVAVLLACRLARHRPSLAHALWLTVLLKFLLPPLIAWPCQVRCLPPWMVRTELAASWFGVMESEPTGATIPARRDDAAAVSVPDTAELADVRPNRTFDIPAHAAAPNEEEPIAKPAIPDAVGTLRSPPEKADPSITSKATVDPTSLAQRTAHCCIALWSVGSLLALTAHLRRMAKTARLVRQAAIAPRHLAAEIAFVAGEVGVRVPRVVVSNLVDTPFIWCLGRALLVWPSELSDRESLVRLRGVIAHELAHVHRRDPWIAWLKLAADCIWWFHPLWWLARRRLCETAEMACDAWAIAALPCERRAYAESFLECSMARDLVSLAPILGVGSRDRKTFERRLAMMLSDRVTKHVTWRGWLAAALLTALAIPSWTLGQDEPTDGAAPPVQEPALQTPPLAEIHADSELEMLRQQQTKLQATLQELQIALQRSQEEKAELRAQMEALMPRQDERRPATDTLAVQPFMADSFKGEERTSFLAGGRMDFVALGMAMVEARGEMEIVRAEAAAAQSANRAHPGTISQSSLEAMLIRAHTAEAKVHLLLKAGHAAREAMHAEIDAETASYEQTLALAERSLVSRQAVVEAESRLRILKATLKVLEACLGK